MAGPAQPRVRLSTTSSGYAIDSTKMQQELHWHPATPFEQGIEKTVRWYLDTTSERKISRRNAPPATSSRTQGTGNSRMGGLTVGHAFWHAPAA